MRILRIKQAEAALAGGRLDEACDLLADVELRSHRQAQQLLDRLVAKLIERGAEHLAAGRAGQALADCQKAVELGGNTQPAADLRARIADAIDAEQHGKRAHGGALAAARQQADAGRLSLAAQVLAEADGDSARAVEICRELELRRKVADRAVRLCEAAMDRGDFVAAVDELLAARAQRADDDGLADLAAKVVRACIDQARREFVRGRVDLVETMLDLGERPRGARKGPAADPAAAELRRALSECTRATRAAQAGQMRQAGEMLRRARTIVPDAAWLVEATDAVDRAAHSAEKLRAGPLGMLGSGTPAGEAASEAEQTVRVQMGGGPVGRGRARAAGGLDAADSAPVLSPVGLDTGGHGAGRTPKRLVVQLDGAGSSLVFLGERVTVGPISSPGRPDLGLMADAGLPIVSVERTDEGDYILSCERAVEINGRPVTGKLLADGDKIALSPRCRMRFRLPTPASATAVIELSTARLPQADIRRVVMMDRELIVGPGSGAHIRADELPGRAVLVPAGGDRMTCRTECTVTRDGRAINPAEGIEMDCPVRVGPLGLVVSRA